MNWLSAKKVRVHGIQSRRWTRKDQIVQHKGLVNLYLRDRKIQLADEHVECKKQKIYLEQLQNDIKENREELGDAINANQQLIRNALADHRNLQLVYQHTQPTKIIENLYQENFNKRKCLDRLNYRLTKKTQTLIDLKLELARLEDALKYPAYANKSMVQMEETSEFVTGKVQSTILKKEAALAVRSTYKHILSILKKDSRYVDAVLRSLTMDTKTQNRCMICTTELGQMAIEYLDDRKTEYDELLRAVKRDRKSREKMLKIFGKEYELLHDKLGKLLRKEDDITVGKVVIAQTREEARHERELKKISNIFDALQTTTHASDFDEIFPVIHDQEMNSIKLEDLLRKFQQCRDSLSTKNDHAEVMETDVANTMHKTTNTYIASNKQLKESLEQEKKRQNQLFDKLHRNRDILLSARKGLQDVLLATECMISAVLEKPAKRETDADRTVQITDSLHWKPSVLETKTKLILKLLTPRLATLMKHEVSKLSESETIQTLKLLEAENKCIFGLPAELPAERDVFDIIIEDVHVPSHGDIKQLSKEIVTINSVDQDLVPKYVTKKKYKPLKLKK